MENKLKIGLLIYDNIVQSWEYDIVKEILNCEYSTVEAVIQLAKPFLNQKCGTHVNRIFRLHLKIDQLIFLPRQNRAKKKDINELTGKITQILINSTVKEESSCINSNVLREIKKLGLDVIIKIGYGPVIDELCELTKFGVWSYSTNDYYHEDNDITGYYEVINRKPVIVSELVARLDKWKVPIVLDRVTEATCPYSISLTREKLLRRASLFIPRILKKLYREGPDYLKKIERKHGPNTYGLIFQLKSPGFLKASINFLKAALIIVQQVFKKIIYTDSFNWFIIYKIGTHNDFELDSYKDFRKIKSPNDRFWADPFVIKRADKYFVFVEEFIYKANKGHISVLEFDGEGNLVKTQKIIENPYHMSYPFVFKMDNMYYMIPETGSNRSIDLYKCTEFPWKWTFVRNIMKDINAVDSTLLNYDGKWWLFTLIDKINSHLAASPELYLFWSDDLMSDHWMSHPMNPVVTDVRYARPAGKLFIKDEKIYRPSQDCSGRYGNSIDLNQILVLNCENYKEKRILKIKPDWEKAFKGTHTYNFYKGFTIMDIYKYRRRFF